MYIWKCRKIRSFYLFFNLFLIIGWYLTLLLFFFSTKKANYSLWNWRILVWRSFRRSSSWLVIKTSWIWRRKKISSCIFSSWRSTKCLAWFLFNSLESSSFCWCWFCCNCNWPTWINVFIFYFLFLFLFLFLFYFI